MIELRQSTAVTVKVGPVVDNSDGDSDETTLTISASDVRLSKNGGNLAAKNESSALTHDEIGVYDCDFDTTDTNTPGALELFVHESGSLHAYHQFMVLSPEAWDAKYAATTDVPRLTDYLVKTDIATLASQTSFTLTDGSADDDAYNGLTLVVVDQTDSFQVSVDTSINDYTGGTKTVTLSADPLSGHTMAVGDIVYILPF